MSRQPQSRRQFLHASSTAWMSASVVPLLQWAASSTASAANPAPIANPAPVDEASQRASDGQRVCCGLSQRRTVAVRDVRSEADAPAEIRGSFSPIATSVTGVQFCELLPRSLRLLTSWLSSDHLPPTIRTMNRPATGSTPDASMPDPTCEPWRRRIGRHWARSSRCSNRQKVAHSVRSCCRKQSSPIRTSSCRGRTQAFWVAAGIRRY